MIPLSRPSITAREKQLVNRVFDSGRLACGPMAEQFAAMVAERAGARYGLAVSSGTAALQLALEVLRIGHGSTVAVPAYGFAATAAVVHHAGAEIKFRDIEMRDSWTWVDPEPVDVAMCVDLFGMPSRLHPDSTWYVQDSCEALGVMLSGDIACFGFYPNKQITTGEGGVLVTNCVDIFERARALANHGRKPGEGIPMRWGHNYRMPELSAALGVAQMERLDEILERRQDLADAYRRDLDGLPITMLPETVGSWFAMPVWCESERVRDHVRAALAADGIETGWYFPALAPLPNAQRLAATVIALPFYTDMDTTQAQRVCDALRCAIERTQGRA